MAKIPFGTINSTIAKLIALNSPKKVNTLVEPFGDGGTFALYMKKKKPKNHIVNIVDEVLFNAFLFAQQMGGSQLSAYKKRDWIGSPEAFDAASAISATEGQDFFYRFMYLRLFGTKENTKDPESPVVYDPFTFGVDKVEQLNGFPLMRVALKGVTIVNGEPESVMSGGDYLVLLPSGGEDTDAARGKLSGISSPYFFAMKTKDPSELVAITQEMQGAFVSPNDIASIMMSTFAIVTNYENKMPVVTDEVMSLLTA